MVDIDTRRGRRPGNEPCPYYLLYRNPQTGPEFYPLDKHGRLISKKPQASPRSQKHTNECVQDEITILDITVPETGMDPKAHATGQVSDTDTDFDWLCGTDDESHFSVDPDTNYFP